MPLRLSLWTFLPTALCLVAPSVGEIQPHSITPDSMLDEKDARYVLLPRILSLAKRAQENDQKFSSDHQKLLRLLRLLEQNGGKVPNREQHVPKKRKFPEIDSRGFDEDIFDEGFGDWSPMKRW